MQHTIWKNQPLSPLTLGTVQFGMPYGIANRVGQPDYPEVVRILDAAIQSGVNCFDTAAAYGDSEEVLGRAFHELRATDDVFVVTKIPALNEPSRAGLEIEQALDQSRRRLRIDCLPMVLFHREEDATYLAELHAFQQRGWVRHVGVSCGNLPETALRLANEDRVEALQAPLNLLDRRHLQSGLLDTAGQNQIALFVRSAFLQGLLLMPEQNVRADLRDAVPARRKLKSMAREAGMSLQTMALRFIASLEQVTSVVVGVDTLEQFRDNLDAINQGPLSRDLMDCLTGATWAVSERTLTPHLWS